MFSFLKRHKPQDVFEISQPEAVRERALKIFSNIEGLDDIKEMMLRALESSGRAHTLLTGPPASAKSLFMLQIEKYMSSKVYFAEGASTTKAGLQRLAVMIIKKLSQNAVIQIASSVWKTDSRDIRDVLKIAKLCNLADTEEDITRLISIHQKYRKSGKEHN